VINHGMEQILLKDYQVEGSLLTDYINISLIFLVNHEKFNKILAGIVGVTKNYAYIKV
jgi:hypothetical protein